MQLNEAIFLERQRLSLFCPVILGFGIIFGVFFPFLSWGSLTVSLVSSLIFGTLIFKKFKILSIVIGLFILGIYVAQTGGIFETSLLTQKKFVDRDYEKIEFFADVGYIDENHPTMKNMKRIIFKNIEFLENKELDFIKTSKMTCPASIDNNILPNDRVKVKAKISPYKIASIPNSFDQKQYNTLIKMDTAGIAFYIKKVESENKENDVFSYIRRGLTKIVIEKIKNPEAGGVAAALLTGDKSSISQEVRDKFINSGTAHILAISGLHMTIVASILFFIFFKMMLYLGCIFQKINARKIAAIITIPLTFLYLAISGFSPSATRAFIMTTICLISAIMGRGIVSLRSISFAAFLILILDSGSLFLVSFQLSFCAVGALIAFYEVYQKKFYELKVNSNKFIFYVIASIITTIIASLATFPVSIATFNRLSLSGILGNLVAIPATTCLIMPLGIVTLALGYFTDIFTQLLEKILSLFIDILGWISEIPGSNLAVKSPENLTLYMIITGGIILCLLKTKLRHIGSMMMFIGLLFWVFESKPDIIIPPETDAICFIEDGKFYATSKQKGRNKILAIQRNLGFSGDIEKKDFKRDHIKFEKKIYKQGLFIWSKNKKVKQIAQNQHPYCPAFYEDVKNVEY